MYWYEFCPSPGRQLGTTRVSTRTVSGSECVKTKLCLSPVIVDEDFQNKKSETEGHAWLESVNVNKFRRQIVKFIHEMHYDTALTIKILRICDIDDWACGS